MANTEHTKLTAPTNETQDHVELDLVMNAAVGAIESYLHVTLGIETTPDIIEWYAHQVAIRIITAHAFGEVTY